MAIFEHRPARSSSRRRQADLELDGPPEEGVGDGGDLLDLPLDGQADAPRIDDTLANAVTGDLDVIESLDVLESPDGVESPGGVENPDGVEDGSHGARELLGTDGAEFGDGGVAGQGPDEITLGAVPDAGDRARRAAELLDDSPGASADPPPVAESRTVHPGAATARTPRVRRRKPAGPKRRRATPDKIAGGGRSSRWPWFLLLVALPAMAYLGYRLNLDPPVLVVAEELLDFGALRQGESGEIQTVRLTNQGQEPLIVSEILVDGEQANDFAVTSDDCRELPLQGEGLCRVGVVFSPREAGQRRARLVIRSNGANGTTTVPLLGTGTAPRLRLDPPRLELGSHTVGSGSPPATLWLANDGDASLSIQRVGLLGLGAADFVLRRDRCAGKTLGDGERCSVEVVFVPTAEGNRQASVEVVSDAGSTPETWLVGRGLPQRPELSLDPARLDFGALPAGQASEPLSVALTNPGSGPLTVRGLKIVEPGAVAGGASTIFELGASDCTAAPVPPSQGCRVELRFRPTGEGEAQAFLEVQHDAGEGLHRLPLVGVGTVPHIALDPRRTGFGETALGKRSSPQTIRVQSTGGAPLVVATARTVGPDAQAFTVSGCEGKSVTPGGECIVEVAFSPRRDGPHRAELVIRHNADSGESRMALNGIGISARLQLSSSALDFGEVRLDRSGQQVLNLSNGGRAVLEIESLRFSGRHAGQFALAADGCGGRTLRPNQSCRVEVAFDPTQGGGGTGARSARLSIVHGSADEPAVVPVTAVAVEPPKPKLVVSPQQFELGTLDVGQGSDIRTVTLRNTGNAPLPLQSVRLAGSGAAHFQIVPGSCRDQSSLPAGADCTVGVRFRPAADGDHSAQLVVEHGGEGGRERVALLGRGRPAPTITP